MEIISQHHLTASATNESANVTPQAVRRVKKRSKLRDSDAAATSSADGGDATMLDEKERLARDALLEQNGAELVRRLAQVWHCFASIEFDFFL